jgi:hypothetical protein
MRYSKEEYFSCYSPNLKEYLELNGFSVKTSFIHVRENKTCWIFERTPDLAVFLEQWTRNKNNIQK